MSKDGLKTSGSITTEYSDLEVLNYLLRSGKISLDSVAAEMKQAELKKILEAHPHPITQGKDGRWRTRINLEDGSRRQIAKATQEKVHIALYEYYKGLDRKSAANAITLETLYPEWLEYKRLKAAASSYIKRLESDWRNYYADTEIVKIPIVNLKKITLDTWAHSLIERTGRRRKQYYDVSVIMRRMLDYAIDLDIISINPLRQVRIDSRMVFIPEKKKSSETQVFSQPEVADLYKVAWADFESGHNTVHKLAPLAVMFQFQTGIRIGELAAVRYSDICDSEIYIQRMYRYQEKEIVEYTKCHHDGRYVILTAMAKNLIETARKYQQDHGMPDDGYIFSVNDKPLSYFSIRKLYTRYCNEIGTIAKSSHKSRKTYISALIDAGVNINEIRELVGHADERTTYNSYCFDRKTKADRVKLVEGALS